MKGVALILSILMMLSAAACGAESSGQEETETIGGSSQAVTEEETVSTEPETSEPVETSAEENRRCGTTEYVANLIPQADLSFLNEYDLSGKTLIPFCTHDGYGAGGSYNTIRETSHAAESPEGLAIEAKDVPSAGDTVAAWLIITRQSTFSLALLF